MHPRCSTQGTKANEHSTVGIDALTDPAARAQVKLLAEPWDCGMYQVGTFPNWDVWGEWNGKFRDDFRCVQSSMATVHSHEWPRACGGCMNTVHQRCRLPVGGSSRGTQA